MLRQWGGFRSHGYVPKVDSPAHQLGHIALLVAFAPWVASACLVAGASVEPEFEAHVVDLVRDGLDPVGPFCRVGNQFACAVTASGRPAVVDVDVYMLSDWKRIQCSNACNLHSYPRSFSPREMNLSAVARAYLADAASHWATF